MNLKEAYTTLELAEGATPEEAKKQYRKLTKKYHPDVSKEKDADEKIKKINEAYECVKNGKGNDREPAMQRGNGRYNPFHRQQVVQIENVELHLSIDFKESVLGCKKEVKYSRKTKCQSCDGSGEVVLNNGCKKCGGRGQVTSQRSGMIFMQTCPECFGKTHVTECTVCHAQGLTQTDVSVQVSVPAGITDKAVLRLQGMGNYAGSLMGFVDQYADVFCHVNVASEPGLRIEGKSVVTDLSISLLDALRGCERQVKTIFGTKGITIKPQSRNHDEVIIPHHGVGGTGDQRVILDVQYPKNVDKLIALLADEVNHGFGSVL